MINPFRTMLASLVATLVLFTASNSHASGYVSIVGAPSLPPSFTSGEVPAVCIAYTAARFEFSPNLILAVLRQEAGRVGLESRNTNGTFDLGPMQINSIWLTVLREHGISRESLRDDGCLNVWVGGWILRLGLNSAANYWRGVGRYHSGTMRADRDLNGNYAERVWTHYQRIDKLEVSWWGLPGLDRISADLDAHTSQAEIAK